MIWFTSGLYFDHMRTHQKDLSRFPPGVMSPSVQLDPQASGPISLSTGDPVAFGYTWALVHPGIFPPYRRSPTLCRGHPPDRTSCVPGRAASKMPN